MLDRCAWVLARHTAVWLDQPGETHEFLAGQPAPYGEFFVGLERVLHDHGPVAMPALLDELRQGPDAEALSPLLDRLAAFHDVDDDESPQALIDAVLQRLRLRAVNDELDLLLESGDLSDDAMARRNDLFALRAELTTRPTASASR